MPLPDDPRLRGRCTVALKKALMAGMKADTWEDLGHLTGTHGWITRHERLLRSLSFGDSDYGEHVYAALRTILRQPAGLEQVLDFAGIEPWLRKNVPEEHAALLSGHKRLVSAVAAPGAGVVPIASVPPTRQKARRSRSVDSEKTEALRLFISHASADKDLAKLIVDLLRSALGLPPKAIRCTSLDGYRLPTGADTDDQIREEVRQAKVLLGLISPASLDSLYVAFELGARWGAGKRIFPLTAPGVDPSTIRGPLGGKNALRADAAGQLHQLVEDVGGELQITPHSPASYQAELDRVLAHPKVQERASAPDVATTVPEGHVVERGITWDVRDGRRVAYCEGCRTGANRMVALSASTVGTAQLFTCPHGHPRIKIGVQQLVDMGRRVSAGLLAQGGAGGGHGINVEGGVKIVQQNAERTPNKS